VATTRAPPSSPSQGGLRFHPTVNLSVIKMLGYEQVLPWVDGTSFGLLECVPLALLHRVWQHACWGHAPLQLLVVSCVQRRQLLLSDQLLLACPTCLPARTPQIYKNALTTLPMGAGKASARWGGVGGVWLGLPLDVFSMSC